MLVDPFIDVLTDAEQRRYVRLLTPKTLREAADAAELYEAMSGIEAKRVETSVSAANVWEGRKKVWTVTNVEDMAWELEELQVTAVRSIRGQSTEGGRSCVSFPTHSGHILELIITNDSSKLNIHPFCIIDTCISDHKTICVDLNLPRPHIKKQLFLTTELIISISLILIKIFLLHFLILNTLI